MNAINNKIYQLFTNHAMHSPNAIALICNDETITYGELNNRANQLAHYLLTAGVKKGDLIGICMERSIQMVIGMLGILKSGATYVPLDLVMPVDRIKYILDCSKTKILISQLTLKNKLSEINATLIYVDEHKDVIASQRTSEPVQENSDEDLAYVIFTSGSTGKPKGVMIYHRAVTNMLLNYQQQLGVTSQDTFLFLTTITFDISVLDLFLPLITGAKVVIGTRAMAQDPDIIAATIQKHNVTFMQATPTAWKSLIINQWAGRHNLNILSGGELLPNDLARQLLPRCKTLWNEYGPTETTIYSALHKVEKIDDGLAVQIGLPIANTQFYIVDKDMQRLPTGVAGEVYIAGIGLAKGYIHRDDLTNERFIPNIFSPDKHERLYKTGDICRYREDGGIDCLGRVDNQIKIRGYRIEPGEIEAILKTHPTIQEAIVIPIKNASDDLSLAAYYTTKLTHVAAPENEILQLLKKTLPDYMIPSSIMKIEKMPTNLNGKTDASQLPKPNIEDNTSYVMPKNDMEKHLMNIWCSELGLSNINATQNFFFLGGHSLSAVRVVNSIRKTLKLDISIQDFYKHPTISELSTLTMSKNVIDETMTTDNIASVITAKNYPMAYSQIGFWSVTTPLNVLGKYRAKGRLNVDALKYAFDKLTLKHFMLACKISSKSPHFLPLSSAECKNIDIQVNDISQLDDIDTESTLKSSLDQLVDINDWKKFNSPLLIVRLFYLQHGNSELQICMPHLICDDVTINLLFKELSSLYLEDIDKLTPKDYAIDYSFLEFIRFEREYVHKNSAQDLLSWDEYMTDIHPYQFPELESNLKSKKYHQEFELTLRDFDHISNIARANNVTVSDLLLAAITSTLEPYAQGETNQNYKNILLTVNKSMRNDKQYDHTIGNFALVDYLKIKIQANQPIVPLAREVQNVKMSTYQTYSPYMFQLTALCKKYWPKKPIQLGLLKIFTSLYALFAKKHQMDRNFLQVALTHFMMKNEKLKIFHVYVNVFNEFIMPTNRANLFGHEQILKTEYEPIRARFPSDMDIFKHTLFIELDRGENNVPCLIVAGDFPDAFRDKIGNNIIEKLRALK